MPLPHHQIGCQPSSQAQLVHYSVEIVQMFNNWTYINHLHIEQSLYQEFFVGSRRLLIHFCWCDHKFHYCLFIHNIKDNK